MPRISEVVGAQSVNQIEAESGSPAAEIPAMRWDDPPTPELGNLLEQLRGQDVPVLSTPGVQ